MNNKNSIDLALKFGSSILAKFTNDVIVLLDRTGKIMYTNERIESWLGYKSSDLIGKNIALAGLMPPTSVQRALKNLALRFLGREIKPYEVEFVTKDKRVLAATINAQLIKDESGKVLGDLVLVTDINDKKRYEEQLALEKTKTDVYLDVVGMIVLVLDRNGKVTLINNKGCEILKTTKSEVIGKDWIGSFIPEEERPRVKEIFNKIVSGEIAGAEKFGNSVLSVSGEKRLISWHNTCLKDKNGNVYEVISGGDDVTEQSEAVQKLKEKTEEMEKSNHLMVGRELRMAELKKEIEIQKKEIERLQGGDKNG